MVSKKGASQRQMDEMRRASSPAFARRDEPPMFPPVNRAAMDNNIDEMVRLLNAGANIEELDNDDKATPLIGAARYDNPDTALELIKRGANVDAKTRGGDTALGWATVNQMHAVAVALILRGADLKTKMNSCDTIPELARQKGEKDFIEAVDRAIEERARRVAADRQREADRRIEHAVVLQDKLKISKPFVLKR